MRLWSHDARHPFNPHAAVPFSTRRGDSKWACDSKDVLLTTSCTDALEMSAMIFDIRLDDTVIVPSFTFASTAFAFARHGATLRFCTSIR